MKELFCPAEFARRVRVRMGELNLSYREAGEASGVHYATLHRIARNCKAPDLETYLRLERWLAQ